MKTLLSILAGILVLVGCGTLADKVDPVVKSGKMDPGALTAHDTNGGD
jgi:PBP1b-binding outer membrane lipoprotein LpoB